MRFYLAPIKGPGRGNKTMPVANARAYGQRIGFNGETWDPSCFRYVEVDVPEELKPQFQAQCNDVAWDMICVSVHYMIFWDEKFKLCEDLNQEDDGRDAHKSMEVPEGWERARLPYSESDLLTIFGEGCTGVYFLGQH